LPICNLIQVFCGVDSKVVGDVDEYLMKLAMGNATGWPENSAPGAGAVPRPVKVGKMLEQAEEDKSGEANSIDRAWAEDRPSIRWQDLFIDGARR
jgi:hypothetical protein